MRITLSMRPMLQVEQKCTLCNQGILPDRQMPFNAILIYKYEMCPSCRPASSARHRNLAIVPQAVASVPAPIQLGWPTFISWPKWERGRTRWDQMSEHERNPIGTWIGVLTVALTAWQIGAHGIDSIGDLIARALIALVISAHVVFFGGLLLHFLFGRRPP